MGSETRTVYIAASLDGYIATEDGGVGWLEDIGEGSDEGSYEAFFATVDCLVMGANTYEQVRGFGEWPYGTTPAVVLSHRDLERANDSVEIVTSEIDDILPGLTEEYGHTWFVGGGEIVRESLRQELVDELWISIVPILLGDGIPLFGELGVRQRLYLVESRSYENGIVEVRYEVV